MMPSRLGVKRLETLGEANSRPAYGLGQAIRLACWGGLLLLLLRSPADAQQSDSDVERESEMGNPILSYFEAVDQVKFRQRVAELREKQQAEVPFDFDGMDVATRRNARVLLDEGNSLTLVRELNISTAVSGSGFDLSPDGTELITVGEKIRIHALANGENESEFKPLREARSVFFIDGTSKFVEVCPNGLVLRRRDDGEQLASWDTGEDVLRVESSRDGSVVAVLTTKLRLFALDGALNAIGEYRGQRLAGPALAVEPSGKWILASTVGAPVRWNLPPVDPDSDDARTPYEYVPVADFNGSSTQACAGHGIDRWYESDRIDAFQGKDRVASSEHTGSHLVHRNLVWTADCETGDGDAWMLCLFASADSEGAPVYSIGDVSLFNWTFSVPAVLQSRPEEIVASQDGEVFAIASGDQLSVYRRRKWFDPTGYATARCVGFYLQSGRLEQLEIWLDAIRGRPGFQFGVTGEDLYSNLVRAVAQRWSDVLTYRPEDPILEKLDAWASSDSVTARTIKAQMHVVHAWSFFADSRANSPEETDWPRYNEQLEKARELVPELLKDGNPASIVFSLAIELNFLANDYEAVSSDLIRHASVHPLAISAHGTAMRFLLPQWSGSSAELQKYATRYSELFSSEDADWAFSRCYVAGFMGARARDLAPEIVEEQFYRSMRLLLGRDELPPDELAKVVEVCRWLPGAPANAEEFAAAYIERFSFARPMTYFSPNVFFNVRRNKAKRLESLVSSKAMETTNWRLAWPPRRYEVKDATESTLSYVNDLDREELIRSLERAGEPGKLPEMAMRFMDDVVREAVESFYLDQPTDRKLLEIPVNAEVSHLGFSLSPDGQTLVTLGEEIKIWNANDGTLVRAIPNAKMFTNVQCIDNKLAVFWGKENLAKYNLSTGKGLGSWTGEILNASTANNGKLTAVVTSQNRIVALDSSLRELAELQNVIVSNTFVSVNPNGEWVAANTMPGPLRWAPNSGEIQVLPAKDHAPQLHQCASGSKLDYWFSGPYGLVYRDGEVVQPFSGTDYPAHMVNMWGLHSQCCEEVEDEWLVACCVLWDDVGKTSFNICDIDFTGAVCSSPTRIEFEPLDFASSRNGSRIAVSNDSSIHVMDRQTWKDPSGQRLVEFAGRLARAGKFDQLGSLVAVLRHLEPQKGRPSGEQMIGKIAQHVGQRWGEIEDRLRNEDDAALFVEQKRYDQWREQAGFMPIASSAARYAARIEALINEMKEAAKLEGKETPQPPVMREDINLLREQAAQELDLLLDGEDPPAYAFEERLRVARDLKEVPEDYNDIVKRYLLSFPNEATAHGVIASWLYPAWNDTYALPDAYLTAWAELYPEELRDTMYAMGAIELYANTRYSTNIARMSRDRLSAASLVLHRERELSAEETLILAAIIKDLGKVEFHLLEHLFAISPLQPKRCYATGMFTRMYHIRNRFSSGEVRKRFENQGLQDTQE